MSETQSTEGVVQQPAPAKVQQTKAERELAQRQREIQLDKAEKVATTATNIFNPIAYAQLKALAKDLIDGGASSADADTPEKLLVKLQAGFELGMTPVQSQNSLYIVSGRVTIWGSALIGRLRHEGWSVRYSDESPEQSTIKVTKGDEEIEDTFFYQDAVDSGYTSSSKGEKVGWRKGQNRKLKLRYGAAAQLVKTYLPEVLNGHNIGITEIDQDAIIEGEATETLTRRDRLAAAESERMGADDYDATPVEAQS